MLAKARSIRTRTLLAAICVGLSTSAFVAAAPQDEGTARLAADEFIAVCYHDVQDVVNDPDGLALSTDNLIAQFDWLRASGWHPVGIDDLVAAKRGQRPLPHKAVLLSFDDGFASFYTRVFPLLRLYGYPAVVGLVGKWMSIAPGGTVAYGSRQLLRERFVTWEQVREMRSSGLVEVASHSFDLHHGRCGNPQGNQMPAMSTRVFDVENAAYESDSACRKRLAGDFQAMSGLLRERLEMQARVMIWPYGSYSGQALELAARHGMAITLGLVDEGIPTTRDLSVVHRLLVSGNPPLKSFVRSLRNVGRRSPLRAINLDLDWLMPEIGRGDEAGLGRLLDRVKHMQINTVWLQCWSDADGDGKVDRLYFPNSELPVRADICARVAWQLRTRAGVSVFAALPRAEQWTGTEASLERVCADLGKYVPLNGIRLHDEAGQEDCTSRIIAAARRHRPELRVALGTRLIEAHVDRREQRFVELEDSSAEAGRLRFPTQSAVRRIRSLLANGVADLSYRTGNFTSAAFDIARLRAAFSLSQFPFER